MMARVVAIAETLLVGLLTSTVACAQSNGGAKADPLSLVPVFSDDDLAARFGGYYRPVPARIEPKVVPYSLPLAELDVANLGDVMAKLSGGERVKQALLSTGFVSVGFGHHDDVAEMYEAIKKMTLPVFVTSDSVLHLYHIQFDETLREIEEKELYSDLLALSRAFQAEMEERYEVSTGREREVYERGLAFFSVAVALLEPDARIADPVREVVQTELDNIETHSGFETSVLFKYREDYSQYVPRGHYTRSEALKRYFKAMMWFGRLTMLIKGHENFGPEAHLPALIPPEEAEVQSMLGCAIAGLFGEMKVDDRSAAQVWERLYTVTAYYVGLADDLTPQDYRRALRNVFGESFLVSDLSAADTFLRLKLELSRLSPPAIYSGTGESVINLDIEPGHNPTPEQLDRILGKTQGFRLMGQRYVPDSYVLGEMVSPAVGNGLGPMAFTTVVIPDHGPVRGFPRGLDVMAVLGSDRAIEILEGLEDTAYERYHSQMKKLRGEFGALSDSDWNRNLYWSWLYALKGLIQPLERDGWPTFMVQDAWIDKQLNAALGSWSSLRHDTILYAKQSYTPTFTRESVAPAPPEPPPVVGYVEPVPQLYARLVALSRMSLDGLSDMEVLDEEARGRLRALEQILSRLLAISEKELANERLTEADYAFIRDFGENLDDVVTGASSEGQKTTLIADVHTDQNTQRVLEEGTGYLRLLLVAYRLPQGHILVGAGPGFSYYEFKHPMSDRLTDERWREILTSSGGPALPSWTESFSLH